MGSILDHANSETVPKQQNPPAGDEGSQEQPIAGSRRHLRRRRHPILSVLVIGLSVYVLVQTWNDFRYFWQARTPENLGGAATLTAQTLSAHCNHYVQLRGAPDRTHSLLLDRRLGGFQRFFRLLQTDSRVFVEQRRPKDENVSFVGGLFRGRMVRLNSLPYSAAIRGHFSQVIAVDHDISADALIAGLATRQFVDVKGKRIAAKPQQLVWLSIGYPDEWIAQLAKQHYRTLAAAQAEVARFNLPYAVDEEGSDTFWRLVLVASAEEVQPLAQYLARPERNSSVIPRHASYVFPLERMGVAEDSAGVVLRVAPGQDAPVRYWRQKSRVERVSAARSGQLVVPQSAIRHVSLGGSLVIPADAMVVLADHEPRGHWPYVVLWLLLMLFIGLNTRALVLYRQPQREVPHW